MSVFDYIFYRIVMYYKGKKDSSPETASSLLVSLLQFLLVFDLFIILRIFYEYPVPANFNKFWALPVLIVLGVINWYRYEKSSRYQDLRKRWKDEEEQTRKKRGKWIVALITILLIIPVMYGLIRHNIMEGKSFFN